MAAGLAGGIAATLDSCPVAAALFAEDGTIRFANKALADIVGKPAAEIARSGAGRLFGDTAAPAAWASAANAPEPKRSEVMLRLAGGGERLHTAIRAQLPEGLLVWLVDAGSRQVEDAASTESDWKLRLVIDNVDEGIALVDADGRLLLYNRRMPELLDLPEELLRSRPTQEEIVRHQAVRGEHAELGRDVDSRVSRHTALVRSGERVRFERAGPHGRIIEVTISPLADGRQIRTFTDVTEQRRAEDRLRESEARLRESDAQLRLVFDNVEQGVLLVDRDNRFVAFNRRAAELLGVTEEELARRPTGVEVARLQAARGDLAQFGADLEAQVAGLQDMIRHADGPLCYVRTRADGRIIEVMVNTLSDGRQVRTLSDVTDRRRAEARVRESEARLRLVFDNIAQGIMLVDSSEHVAAFNRRTVELLGLPDEFLAARPTGAEIARKLAELGHLAGYGSDVETQTSTVLARARAAKGPFRYERQNADGRVLDIAVNPLSDGGKVRTYTDVTAARKAETELATKTAILEATLENMGDAIAMLDRDLNVIAYNRLFVEYFELPDELFQGGLRIERMARHLARRGVYGPGDPDVQVPAVLATFRVPNPTVTELVLPSGRIVEIHHNPLPDGKVVRRYTDVTARRRAEADLAAKTAILEATLENMGEGITMLDGELQVIAYNRTLLEMFDLPADFYAELPKPVSAVLEHLAERGAFGPGDPATHVSARLAAFTSRERAVFEFAMQSGRTLEIHHNPLPDGKLVRRYTDVTARRKAEAELAAKTAILETTLENMGEGIGLIDEHLDVVVCNRTLLDMLGMPAEFRDRLPIAAETILRIAVERGDYGPGNTDPIVADLLERMASRERRTLEFTLPDGRVVQVHHNPLPDGKLVRRLTDITARKHAEAALLAQQQEIEELLDAIPLPVVLIDPSARTYLHVNRRARELYGVQVGPSTTELFADPSDRNRLAALLERDGRVDEFETRFRTIDGEDLWALVTARHVKHRDISAILAVHSPINERKQLETDLRAARDQAEAATHAKSAFLANMSHEIRTPLNGVIANLELLGLTPIDNEQSELVRAAELAARSLLTIIGDILDFSKIEAGHLELELGEVAPEAVIEEVASLLATAARRKGLSLVTHVAADVPAQVRSDPVRLRQVLLNLVGNAIKFTERGSVHLALEREGTGDPALLRFAVHDTGIGVDKFKAGDLFAAFAQADGSTQRRFGGTGLGLAISKHLVEILGGAIDYDSRPGEGSTFHFTIAAPVIAEMPGAEADMDLADADILVVEPDARSADAVAAALRTTRASLTFSTGSADACARVGRRTAEGRPFAVAVVAERLPDGSGLDLPAAVAETPTNFVLLSGGEDLSLRRRAHRSGFTHYVPKPFRAAELRRLVAGAAGRRPGSLTEPTPAGPSPLRRFVADRPILVVEDNPTNQAVARRQLKALGLDCIVAENGQAGLEALAKTDVALVLLDLSMPVMDGFEMARRVRAKEADRGGRRPIIAMSANVLEGDQSRALAVGMDDYLSKPVSLLRLSEMLARWLPTAVGDAAPTTPAAEVPDSAPPIDPAALMATIGVSDPADAADILRLLVDTMPPLLDCLTAAASRRDSAAFRDAAHAAKGAARSAAAERLGSVLAELEAAGRAADWATADRLLPDAARAFAALSTFVSRLRPSGGR